MKRRIGFLLLATGIALMTGAGALLDLRAQTGGPIQKEQLGGGGASGVDEFTGSFSYSIPLMTVPGPSGLSYPIVLSYRSGESPEAGVSWVGYGWSINPGAIVRDQKGLPDDWVGEVTYYNKVKDNWTVTGRTNLNLEVTSYDFRDTTQNALPLAGGLSYSEFGRYNNYLGYSRIRSFGAAARGVGSLTYSSDDDGGHVSGSISPFIVLTALNFFRQSDSYARLYKSPGFSIAERMGSYLVGGQEFKGPYPSPTAHFTGISYNYSHTFTLSIPPWLLGIGTGGSGSYTRQRGDEETSKTAYGYMYSGQAGSDGVMDYHLDKNVPFYKESTLLPIPFADVDNFIATGTAYNGSFRLYSQRLGQFHPTASLSSIDIWQVGVEITGGGRLGLGADFGAGSSSLSVNAWNDSTYSFPSSDGPRDFLMLANGDVAAGAEYSADDAARRATIVPTFGTGMDLGTIKSQSPSIGSSIRSTLNGTGTANRSTFISFTTRGEINERTDKGVFYKAHSRDPILRTLVDRESVGGIEELAVTDPAGNRLVYGLPVYARNEERISYGIEGLAKSQPSAVHSNFSAYTPASLNYRRVIGTVQQRPYAGSFLLTEMTSPEYVDRTFNGPTPDDFGGYVKFNYARAAGAPNKESSVSSSWYRWRIPYRGLVYMKGSLSDPDDDLGSYSRGEREIYYLQSIETRTHIALFITNATDTIIGGRHIVGSGDLRTGRMDGYQAPAEDAAVRDSNASGAVIDTLRPNASRKLERIELWVKNAAGAPDSLLSTVFLGYDYSLRPGMPSSLKNPDDTTKRLGMLTLRKIWFQNQGVVNARIAPYTFGYQYPDSMAFPKSFRSAYPEIARFGGGLADSAQNPSYSEFDVDPWGAYQHGGRSRYAQLRTWVNQAPSAASFDPAAWQLKTIRTPTGGETRIQYEQNDYAYVQDRQATAMVSLVETPASGALSVDDDTHAQYYLNLADLGIPDSSLARVSKAANVLKSYFLAEKNKIYFKLLYALKDNVDFASPEFTSEHITGYGKVTVVRLDTIATSPYKRYGVIIEILEDGEFNVPRKICRDFARKTRRGKIGYDMGVTDGGDAKDRVAELMNRIDDIDFEESHYCQELDFANSYVRIPVPGSKLGGGVRVKRMLSFDPGIEGDSAVYGTEYIYTAYDAARNDTISSGVAANEPSAIREENPLFALWITPDRHPDLWKRLIFGRDKEQYEGPIAPSLLPMASVGYARVTKRNIHTGESNPGFSIASFFTARDYPLVRSYPGIGNSVEMTDINSSYPQQSTVALGPVHSIVDNVWLSQGYRFITNAMHGRPRSMHTYGGNWNNRESWLLSASTEYSYFEPGEKVPMIDSIGGTITDENPGKRSDVYMEGRQVEDLTNDGNVEGDVTMFIPFDIQPSGSASISSDESRFHSHVTTKVIHYPAIVKNVLTYRDGTYSYARTAAIDRISGQPVISEGTDGFHAMTGLPAETGGHGGLYHSMTYPAFRAYPELGPKAGSERLLLNPASPKIAKKLLGGGRIILYKAAVSGVFAFKDLTSGDLVVLRDAGDVNNTTFHGFYHVRKTSADTIDLLPVSTSFSAAHVDSGSVQVEVIRSGRKNQLGVAAGRVTTYGLRQGQIDSGTYRSTSGSRVFIANAIGGSAVQLRDSVVYDTSGIGPVLSGANDYELGRRGRWLPVTSYVLRRNIVAGSGRDTSQRTWRRAGTIDTFTVFNWRTPSLNDTLQWLRGESIVRYSYDGAPLESIDPIGIPSASRLGYRRLLPVVSAGNARQDRIFFRGFEEDSGAVGVVRTRESHSGEYCLQLLPGKTVTVDSGGTALTDTTSFTAVIRYWRRNGGDTAAPAIRLRSTLVAGDTVTGTRVRIARAGDWSLYETVCTRTIHVATGNTARVLFDVEGSQTTSDTIYVDDIRIGPPDAVMTCTVYDRTTYRPLATFDADHFGAYAQYDAEGRMIRQIVETVEGRRTVAETHAHVPLVDRTASESGPTSRIIPASGSGGWGDGGTSLYSGADDADGAGARPSAGATFDLLDIDAGPDGISTKVFGIGSRDLESLILPDLESIGAPSLSLLEKKTLVDSLMAVEERARELDSIGAESATDAERRAAAQEAAELGRRRVALLETLGISEEEWREMERRWRSEAGAGEESSR